MRPTHIPRACSSPIPKLIPCSLGVILQVHPKFSHGPFRFKWKTAFLNTDCVSMLSCKVTQKILSKPQLSIQFPNKSSTPRQTFFHSQYIILLNKPYFLFSIGHLFAVLNIVVSHRDGEDCSVNIF